MIHVLLWFLIVIQIISALGSIILVGEERKASTYTVGGALTSVILAAIFVPFYAYLLGQV